MNIRSKGLLILGLCFLYSIHGQSLMAQNHDHDDHSHYNHEHHRNEIGIANSAVYFLDEEEFSYGLHAHYIRIILGSKFGVGAGYERIFDEHKHNSLNIIGSFSPVDHFLINLSPGVAFEGGELSDLKFALHFETSYEIELNDFHIGPAIEFAYDQEDYHISLGIHLGYGF